MRWVYLGFSQFCFILWKTIWKMIELVIAFAVVKNRDEF